MNEKELINVIRGWFLDNGFMGQVDLGDVKTLATAIMELDKPKYIFEGIYGKGIEGCDICESDFANEIWGKKVTVKIYLEEGK